MAFKKFCFWLEIKFSKKLQINSLNLNVKLSFPVVMIIKEIDRSCCDMAEDAGRLLRKGGKK